MANEYVELATLKEQVGIEADDATRDGLLNKARGAASRAIDRATGRRFWLDPEPVTRTYRLQDRIVCDDDGERLLVDDIGSITGLVVETGSGASFTTLTNYETSPDNALADGYAITGLLRVNGTWGTATTRARITAQFGWPTIPDDIAEAALIQSSRLFKRKDSAEGVTGSAEWGVIRLSRRDPDVWNLIEPFILPGFG
ncbi:phage gp6-like head-tail connector protein [Streptomyces caniscabiei]|uniref:phage gp6-like head-tail connector protein n=1 Tax=Streptomyces caniscabiei TaxID=2746961 RepID=UPI0029B5FC52|nr:phage gp6-like head-tail connector protein [Streptomyces caniscabiei]MDX2948891.1 phage gp6-like head-tail connector protein [Streptomyces caniscabiei]